MLITVAKLTQTLVNHHTLNVETGESSTASRTLGQEKFKHWCLDCWLRCLSHACLKTLHMLTAAHQARSNSRGEPLIGHSVARLLKIVTIMGEEIFPEVGQQSAQPEAHPCCFFFPGEQLSSFAVSSGMHG